MERERRGLIKVVVYPVSSSQEKDKDEQNESKANHGGDYYREYEMNYLVSHTVNNSDYTSQQDWFILGDTNSRSRLDNWYYDYADDNTTFLVHDVILNNTNLKDVIDNWTIPSKSEWNSTSFYEPSDHHPILIDFEI